MNSLVIGNTSQLSHYFPEEYEKISSRDIDLKLYENKFYDRVFMAFGENRINEIKDIATYIKTNTIYTMQLVEFFKNISNYVIVYGSCELWNDYYGEIDLTFPFKFDNDVLYRNYCISKKIMIEDIHKLNSNKIIVLYPFNFNSPYRKPKFLFHKIFDSIINKKKIEIGNTYFYRDMIHPKYVVEKSLLATSDEIVGSGRLTHVNDFIRKLYRHSNLKYEDYVTEIYDKNLSTNRKIFYLRSNEIKYNRLLEDTLNDIRKN
jgi:hypothetical protein